MSTASVNVQSHRNGIIDELVYNGGQMQEKYILPPDQRPKISEVSFCSESIPVVDLKDLDGPNRKWVVEEIRRACEEEGFFQIVNHDVPVTVMKSMMEMAKEFFEMPVEDRTCLYSEDTDKLVRFSTSFNNHKGKVLNWRDYLIHSCHPLEEVIGSWPQKPAAYREIVGKYAMEVVSNGRFKSAEHRAVTNGSTARLSIPTFYGPSYDAFLSPAASMVGEHHPPLYRGYKVGEFMGMFWNKELSSKAVLDSFKIEYPENNGE